MSDNLHYLTQSNNHALKKFEASSWRAVLHICDTIHEVKELVTIEENIEAVVGQIKDELDRTTLPDLLKNKSTHSLQFSNSFFN